MEGPPGTRWRLVIVDGIDVVVWDEVGQKRPSLGTMWPDSFSSPPVAALNWVEYSESSLVGSR